MSARGAPSLHQFIAREAASTGQLKPADTRRACKLGTVPALVWVDGRSTVQPGKWVRVKEAEGGAWTRVYVYEVRDDGYFMADR